MWFLTFCLLNESNIIVFGSSPSCPSRSVHSASATSPHGHGNGHGDEQLSGQSLSLVSWSFPAACTCCCCPKQTTSILQALPSKSEFDARTELLDALWQSNWSRYEQLLFLRVPHQQILTQRWSTGTHAQQSASQTFVEKENRPAVTTDQGLDRACIANMQRLFPMDFYVIYVL